MTSIVMDIPSLKCCDTIINEAKTWAAHPPSSTSAGDIGAWRICVFLGGHVVLVWRIEVDAEYLSQLFATLVLRQG